MQRLAEIEISAEELSAARGGDAAARRMLFERVAPAHARPHPPVRAAAGPRRRPAAGHTDRHVRAPGGFPRRGAVRRLGAADRRQPLPDGVPFALASRARDARCAGWSRAASAPSRATAAPSDLIDLDRALARLSPVTRAVVWLYDVEGWSHEEIAQRLRAHREFLEVAARTRTRAAAGRLAAPVASRSGASLGSEIDGH